MSGEYARSGRDVVRRGGCIYVAVVTGAASCANEGARGRARARDEAGDVGWWPSERSVETEQC